MGRRRLVVEAFWQNRLSVAQERLLLLLLMVHCTATRADPIIYAQTPLRPETAVHRGAPAGATISHDSPVERGFNRPISPERHNSSVSID